MMEKETYKYIEEEATKELKTAIDKLVIAIKETWSSIVEVLNNLIETREEIEQAKSLRKTWNVPVKMVMHHQVLDRTPLQANIRNCI